METVNHFFDSQNEEFPRSKCFNVRNISVQMNYNDSPFLSRKKFYKKLENLKRMTFDWAEKNSQKIILVRRQIESSASLFHSLRPSKGLFYKENERKKERENYEKFEKICTF